MKQVRIWIAVCPIDKEITWRWYLSGKGSKKEEYELRDKILEIISQKIEIWHPAGCLMCKVNYNNERYTLDEGESFETVLKALWELQKSLLPEGCNISNFHLDAPIIVAEAISTGHEIHDFYDPHNHIITITDFGVEG